MSQPQQPATTGALRRSLLGFFLPVGLLFSLIYVAYLDYLVRSQFEGKRWTEPVKVYAAPQVLSTGIRLTPERLVWQLEQLHYRRDPHLASQASFLQDGQRVVLRTRPFAFWDGEVQSSYLHVTFNAAGIQRIEDQQGGVVQLPQRLDPALIGVIYPGLHEDRMPVRLDDVPQPLLQGLLATEDRDFFEHAGISPRGILRAMWVNLLAGEVVQGGSTLTQQLAKNMLLTSERSVVRKLNEVIMAMILDARYDKQAILEAYLNEIYLGQDGVRAVHGFAMASEYYFSMPLHELQLHHIALLVALVRGPSWYDPLRYPDRARARRDRVLDAMMDLQFISQRVCRQAKAQPLDVILTPHRYSARYPAFLDMVRREFRREYPHIPAATEGLRIFTTLDLDAQRALESGMAHVMPQLDRLAPGHGSSLEAAGIILGRSNGRVLALAGSRRVTDAGFNRALDATRSIGSLYKPVVYLTALESGDYTPETLISDEPVVIRARGAPDWIPGNYDHRTHGSVTLREALAQSYNLATVHLGMKLGVAETAHMLHQLGVNRGVEVVPSLLLGSCALTPMEVSELYLALANRGRSRMAEAIIEVVSAEGRVLPHEKKRWQQRVQASSVMLLESMLQEVVRSGTASGLQRYLPAGFSAAGKTGTSNELRDSWFAGFVDDYVATVWVGRDDDQPAGLTGAQGALPVWGAAMGAVLGKNPP